MTTLTREELKTIISKELERQAKEDELAWFDHTGTIITVDGDIDLNKLAGVIMDRLESAKETADVE